MGNWHPLHIHINDYQVVAVYGQLVPVRYHEDTTGIPPFGEFTTSLFSSAVVAGHSAAAGVASCAAERGGAGSTSEPRNVETRMKTRSADRRMDHPSYATKTRAREQNATAPNVIISSSYHRDQVLAA